MDDFLWSLYHFLSVPHFYNWHAVPWWLERNSKKLKIKKKMLVRYFIEQQRHVFGWRSYLLTSVQALSPSDLGIHPSALPFLPGGKTHPSNWAVQESGKDPWHPKARSSLAADRSSFNLRPNTFRESTALVRESLLEIVLIVVWKEGIELGENQIAEHFF